MRKFGWAVSGLVASALPFAAQAQTAPAQGQPPAQPARASRPEPEPQDPDEIVVTGGVQRGAVEGDIKPEIQYSPADIKAMGVSSISELLTELAPQTRSGRGSGAPVVLLNGRRISGFQEIQSLPPEAIERVDILPEEVSLKYGYRADQRVINIVLRQRFRSIEVEANGGGSTGGGAVTEHPELTIVKINRAGRINLSTEYTHTSGILESDRDIVPTNPGDNTQYRTLLSPSQALTINGVYSRNISIKTSATFNAKLDVTHRISLLGADPNGGQLPSTRDVAGRTAHLGTTFNGDFTTDWRWSLTGNYDRVNSRTANNASNNAFAPPDNARSLSNLATVDALVHGPLFKLPAGDVATSVRISGRTNDYSTDSLRSGITRSSDLSRDSGSTQINLDVPIASKRKGFLGAIGDLSLNGNVEIERLSDFGTLVSTGYGAVWTPFPKLRLIASVADEDNAPSVQQLGDPVLSTPNVRTFDYVRGESVNITSISGGNPNLVDETRHALKLGLNFKPFDAKDLTFSVDYNDSTTRNQLSAFPAATANAELAFPGRFVRDGSGELISIDSRPVNFERADSEQLRWGFNFSVPLGSTLEKKFQERRAQRDAERAKAQAEGKPLPPEGPPQNRPPQPQRPATGFFGTGGGGGGGFGGGGGRGPGGGGGGFRGLGGPNGLLAGRINFSLYHTWHMKEQVLIRSGLPVIDLLNGGATGSRGGQSEHEIEAQGGITKDGFGMRFNAKWQSATEVDGGTPLAPQDLHFSSLGTVGVRLFVDMGQQLNLVRKHRWLLGTRVSLGIDNILDSHQRVTDQNGLVPLSYQPDLLDPTGRVIRFQIRKLFF